MMSGRAKAILAEAAAVAGPLLILCVARLMLGSVPVTVNALGAAAAPVVPVVAARPPSPEQQRASEWIRTVAHAGALKSPMDHPVALPKVEKTPDPAPTQAPVEIVHVEPTSPLAGLTLTGVLGNSSGGLAAINGRVYRIGDHVKALVLTAIDVKGNAVDLKTAEGTVLRLVRPPPN
jgi:hypothetical protein